MARWVGLLIGVFGVGCGPPRATLLTELPEAQEVAASAERYRLSPDNTEVEAEISAAATFTLGFTALEGALTIEPEDPASLRLDLTVDMTSATSSIDKVAEIAKSDHFLDVAVFPTASFVTHETLPADDAYETVAVLDLHGIRRGLRMPATVRISPCAVDVGVAFSFDRHAFEMQTEGALESMVSDTVSVIIHAKVDRPCPSAATSTKADSATTTHQ